MNLAGCLQRTVNGVNLPVTLGIIALLVFTGCGHRNDVSKAPSADPHAFDAAPADVAQLWQTATTASKNNDFETAQKAFVNLSRMELTTEQANLYNQEKQDFDQKLTTAANKGDPAAVKVIEEMRNSRSRH